MKQYIRWGIFNAVICALIVWIAYVAQIYIDVAWQGWSILIGCLAGISFLQALDLPPQIRFLRRQWLQHAVIANSVPIIVAALCFQLFKAYTLLFIGAAYGAIFAAIQGYWLKHRYPIAGSWLGYMVLNAIAYEFAFAGFAVMILIAETFTTLTSGYLGPGVLMILLFAFVQVFAMQVLLGNTDPASLEKAKEKPKH